MYIYFLSLRKFTVSPLLLNDWTDFHEIVTPNNLRSLVHWAIKVQFGLKVMKLLQIGQYMPCFHRNSHLKNNNIVHQFIAVDMGMRSEY